MIFCKAEIYMNDEWYWYDGQVHHNIIYNQEESHIIISSLIYSRRRPLIA